MCEAIVDPVLIPGCMVSLSCQIRVARVCGLVGDPLGPNGRRNESAIKSGRARLVEFGHNLVAPLVRFILDFVVQLVPIQLCSG